MGIGMRVMGPKSGILDVRAGVSSFDRFSERDTEYGELRHGGQKGGHEADETQVPTKRAEHGRHTRRSLVPFPLDCQMWRRLSRRSRTGQQSLTFSKSLLC